ncbi:MAG: acetyl-CoA carboxylase, biotin carboxyl carrier protein, partial [Hyphomicrobium sp.]
MTAKEDPGKADADQKLIRDLAQLLNETGLSEIEIEKSGLKIRVARTLHVTASAPVAHASGAAPAAA